MRSQWTTALGEALRAGRPVQLLPELEPVALPARERDPGREPFLKRAYVVG